MYPLLLCSIFAFAIIIERFTFFYFLGKRHKKLIRNVLKPLKERDINTLIKLTTDSKCMLGSALNASLSNYLLGKEEMRKIADETIAYETTKLEKYLQFLAAIASISTLLGFTGTVFGMINAFESISLHGASSPAVVARGISEALITTAFGLIIAIPSAAFFYYFTYRVDKTVTEIGKITTEIINAI